MSSYIWKPASINTWKKGISFLAPDSTDRSQAPTVKGPNGQIYTGKYINTNEGRHQWTFPSELAQMKNLQVSYGGQTGNIGSGASSFEGGDLGGWQARAKGSLGDTSASYPGQFAPGSAGGYGIYPGYLGGMFPNPSLAPNYKPVDPFKFGAKYGTFARGEISKNFAQAQDLSNQTLNNELKNLQTFVPAASALKRSETSADNQFNQDQRAFLVNNALPEADADFMRQRERANSYVQGNLSDDQQNSALELGIRSRAADISAGKGFGAQSSVALKTSDLMSAEERLQIAQYGETLLNSNIKNKADLYLPPTEYSNAGSQIQVNPSLSSSQLTGSYLGTINSNSLVPASTALGSSVQQAEYGNQVQANNAAIKNTFALDKFGYNVGYAGAVAGAAQTDVNTGIALDQQAQARQDTLDAAGQSRTAGTISSVTNALGTTATAAGSLFGKGGPFDVTGGSASGVPDISPPGGFLNTDSGGGSSSVPSIIDNGTPSFSNDYNGGESGGGSSSVPSIIDNGTPSFDASLGGESFQPLSAPIRSFSNDTGVGAEKISRSAQITGTGTLSGAGITYQPGNETQPIGNDSSGRPLFGSIPLMKSTDASAGAALTANLHEVLSNMGALAPSDSSSFQKIASAATDGSLVAVLNTKNAEGDNKGFVDTILKNTINTGVEAIAKGDGSNTGIALGAHQLSEAWGSMSPAQKSLGIATLGLQGYKSKDGKSLVETPLVKPQVNRSGKLATPGLTVGEGMQLFKEGYNTYSLVKNWDQLNTLQKVVNGNVGTKETADVAKTFNLMGTGVSGAATPNVTEDSLAKSNWRVTPNLGVGAITSSTGSSLPQGYSVVARGKEGTVAVPTANKDTQAVSQSGSLIGTKSGVAGVTNSAHEIYKTWTPHGKDTILNGALGGSAMSGGLSNLGKTNPYILSGLIAHSITSNTLPNKPLEGTAKQYSGTNSTVQDVTKGTQSIVNAAARLGSSNAATGAPYVNAVAAGENVYNVFSNPNSTDKQKAEAVAQATQASANISAQLGSQTAGNIAPGINVAMGVYNASKVLGSNLSGEAKARALQKAGEDTAASIETFGLSNVAQFADAKFAGGKGEKIREKLDKLNPAMELNTLAAGKVLEMTSGGKSGDQGSRDSIRSRFQQVGLADKNYNVTLADGTQVNIGIDGHGGQHSVTDSSKLTKDQSGVKTLNSWDTDYTNDLDYSAGMMGSALSRLVNGGKGTSIDQLGGQLGNALLGKDGFGRGYSESNFNSIAANARAVAAQSGIKSKADAYQLANQAYAEGRLNESDHQAALQAFNMMYDKDGYKTGQSLMSGRFRGIEVAGDSAPSSEDTSKSSSVPANKLPQPSTTSSTPAPNMKGIAFQGGGSSLKTQPQRSIIPLKDTTNYKPLLSRSKDELRQINKARYASQSAAGA